jgi:hypothetical protein
MEVGPSQWGGVSAPQWMIDYSGHAQWGVGAPKRDCGRIVHFGGNLTDSVSSVKLV